MFIFFVHNHQTTKFLYIGRSRMMYTCDVHTFLLDTYVVCTWAYNTNRHRGVGDAIPYELVFGQVPQVGISFLPLAPVILDSLHTEAQYCQALFSVNADGVEGSLEVEDNGHVNVDDAQSEENLLLEADGVDDAQSVHALSNNYPAFAGLNLYL
jgi:hypothetical protein